MKQNNGSSIPVKVLRYLLMAFVLVISLYPILWVLLNSFKQTPGGLGLPEKWVFDGYITIFTKLNIGQYFLNSLIVTVISTVISVFAVSLAAYVSARISFKGKSLVTLMFASTLFIPSISISFPIYRLLSDLGLKDTLTGGHVFHPPQLLSLHSKGNGGGGHDGRLRLYQHLFQDHCADREAGPCHSRDHGVFE